MDGTLYNIIYSEKNKTIRFQNEKLSELKTSGDERLISQVCGSSNAVDISGLIHIIRPDLAVISNEINEFE